MDDDAIVDENNMMKISDDGRRRRDASSYSNRTILAIFVIAAATRYWLMCTKYQQIIANQIGVATPLNSWKRILEGLHLQRMGINPYDGDLLHEPPLSLLFYRKLLIDYQIPVELIFIAFDMGSAYLMYLLTKKYLFGLFSKQEKNEGLIAKDSNEFLLTNLDLINTPVYVLIAFSFNPFSICNCVGYSTTCVQNFFLTTFLYSTFHGNLFVTMSLLSLCTMTSFYPIILIIPACLHYSIKSNKVMITAAVLYFLLNLAILNHLSLLSNKGFHQNVYGFILTVPDLQPNIGLFWYFFTEMFDHFRDLFICSFQINVTILYLVPLSIKFRNDPFLLTVALLFLTAIFKSYPSVGDIGYIFGLLPAFRHLFVCSQQGFLVGVIYLITSVLGPLLWHLWIYANSANANFYFGVTLAFAIGQIFFVTDLLFAHLKREFCLKYGKERRVDGKLASLVLE